MCTSLGLKKIDYFVWSLPILFSIDVSCPTITFYDLTHLETSINWFCGNATTPCQHKTQLTEQTLYVSLQYFLKHCLIWEYIQEDDKDFSHN